jgi:hypothetical protein
LFVLILTTLVLSCARPPPEWVWDDAWGCALPAPALEACVAQGGTPGRPWRCSGTPPELVTPREQRRSDRDEDRAFRRGEAECTCITMEYAAQCAAVP